MNKEFLTLFDCDSWLGRLRRPVFVAAVTSIGMGKTRIVRDWAREILKKNQILSAFVAGEWTSHIETDLSTAFNYSSTEEFEWITPTLPTSIEFKNAKDKFNNLARLFLFELKDSVESSRFMGIRIFAEMTSRFRCSEAVLNILNASALFNIVSAAGGTL